MVNQIGRAKNTDAIYFLATAYKGNGIPANNEKYITYLQQAAMLGNSNAQAEIGYLYLIGKELPQNLPDAGVWFKKQLLRVILLHISTGKNVSKW